MPRRTENLDKYMGEYRKTAACARKIAAMYVDTLELESHPRRVLSVQYIAPQTAYDAYLAAGGVPGQRGDFADVYVDELIHLCQPYVEKIAKTI